MQSGPCSPAKGNFIGFGTIEQIVDVAKEVFAGEVSAEHLFLKRTPRPIGEGRVFGIQDAFIEKSDHGVDRHLRGFVAVAYRRGVFNRRGNHLAQSRAEGIGIFNTLNEKPGAQDDGENFLEGQGEVIGPNLLRS